MAAICAFLSGLAVAFGFIVILLWGLVMVAIDWEEIYFLFYERCVKLKFFLLLVIIVHYVMYTPWLDRPFIPSLIVEAGIVFGIVLLILVRQAWVIGWSWRKFLTGVMFAVMSYGWMMIIEVGVRYILKMLH